MGGRYQFAKAVEQNLHIVILAVRRQACPGGAFEAERTNQGLRAMVTAAQRHAADVEMTAYLLSREPLNGKGNDAAPIAQIGGSKYLCAADRHKPLKQSARQPQLVLLDSLPIERLHPIKCRPESDGCGNRSVPASNRRGGGRKTVSVKVTSPIICPPVMKGGMAASNTRRPHSTPMPVGPKVLCPEKGIEIDAKRLYVERPCGARWAPSSMTFAPSERAVFTTQQRR